jgi:hypothetical protein
MSAQFKFLSNDARMNCSNLIGRTSKEAVWPGGTVGRVTGFFAPPAEITPARRRAARLVAFAADALQLALFPLFGEGIASPLDDALDVAVALLLIKLLGFHWAFLPAAAAELVPVVDLAPTWTAAVLIVAGPPRKAVFALAAALFLLTSLAAFFFWRR